MMKRMHQFYQSNKRWTPIAFFIAGFIFDAFMLRRVDELLTILQQAAYILMSAILLRLELIETQRPIALPNWLQKIWHYRDDLLHFLMGTLLNAYTIFFFKSSSALTSLIFIAILVSILIMNEFGRFGKSQTQVHVGILSLCLISYLVTLVPIVLGFIGSIPFLLANAIAMAIFILYVLWMRRTLPQAPKVVLTHLYAPFFLVLALYNGLYFTGAIPPVPLSVRYIGIYHQVEKVPGGYELSYNRPEEYFWQHGDQTFLARPGDVIFCFARVFSPARFKDELQVHWLFKDPKHGWESRDHIPFQIVGGRDEGFRGVTKKSNYQAGDWRVQIETRDGRELGRMNFKVKTYTSTDPRPLRRQIE